MQPGIRELSEDGAVCFSEEGDRLTSAALQLAEVRANCVDAVLGFIIMELGLERTSDGAADGVEGLRRIENAQPGINIASGTLGSVRAGLDMAQSGWVDNGASVVGF